MNAAHLHLILNHSPLFSDLAAILLLGAGTLLRKRDLVTAALVAAMATGALAAATFVSGRAAADVIGRVDGVDQEAIGPHEAAATTFTIAAIVSAIVAAAALRWPRVLPVAGLAILLAFLLGAFAADRGGGIHHPELSESGGEPPHSQSR